MAEVKERPTEELPDRAAWAQWLGRHHDSATEVWLKTAKKGTGVITVSHAEALEEAIRYGWIDGQRIAYDHTYFLQRFTPRGRKSKWSQVNRQTAQRLIDEGRMHPAGLAQVQAARRDGRWDDAYEPQSRATVPDDLQAALDRNPDAKAFFETLTGARRYAFLYRLHNVKRPENRARRIESYIELLGRRQTLHD